LSSFDPQIPNQPVRHLFNPSLHGITTGRTRQLGTTLHVQVQINTNDLRYLPFDELDANTVNVKGIEDLLDLLKFGKVGDLARILTFHKISSNLSNVFYAMQASRTDFYAYQFKPVYKYIESLTGRILIADEVGLGKTIEAGLIWQETKARHPDARRLLVVCPSMLREKWKKELRERFDTRAEIYDAKGILELLADFRREGTAFQCAAVCTLNTIRQDRIREALEEMNDAHRFDLVIIDEAHHLRNSETKSHRAGLTLSDATEAMVLLTATPIHLGSEDLYRLLRLLDANEFSDFEIFRQHIEENEPLVRAQNLLRRNPPQIAGIELAIIRCGIITAKPEIGLPANPSIRL
jgi:SNF2 family DNA or RNA helicase